MTSERDPRLVSFQFRALSWKLRGLSGGLNCLKKKFKKKQKI